MRAEQFRRGDNELLSRLVFGHHLIRSFDRIVLSADGQENLQFRILAGLEILQWIVPHAWDENERTRFDRQSARSGLPVIVLSSSIRANV